MNSNNKGHTLIHQQGICCVCGKLYPMKGGVLLAHGTRTAVGMQYAPCAGSGRPHYGSPDAPEFLHNVIQRVQRKAEPRLVEMLIWRLNNWKPVEPIELRLR